jgi:uncharacterized protein
VFEHQVAWYVAGPVLGLCVVACRALFNARLGVTGGISNVVDELRRGRGRIDWRGCFLMGIVVGAVLFGLLGGPRAEGYGWLTATFHGSGRLVAAALLLAAGGLIGFGAKTAGGCTSGNGLTGSAMLSPASLVATATFFGTAIAVSFAIEAVI